YMTVAAVWTVADIFNGLMALPNLIAIIALSGVIAADSKDYFKRIRASKKGEHVAVYHGD
ncbi:MAG: alanine:cation symporter family protein, partial [Ruminococcus sp.]|nr:alanine:cation symporter family protein [Ruminococcus sp.]